MTLIYRALFLCTLLTVSASVAFGHKYPSPPPEFFQLNRLGRPATICPGDVLTVRFFYDPELNKTVKVREDGKISLDFFQGIDAAGVTPEELQKKLVSLYSREFLKPEITVDLDPQTRNSVYVTGEVGLPGAKEWHGNLTVAMVLAMSQVGQKTAGTKSVFLVRNTEDKKFTVYKLDASFPNGSAKDLEVAPGDILFVPRKAIVKADDFMDQYIRELLPATPSASTTVLFTPGNPTNLATATSAP